jgi:hypothetical protein
MLKLEIVVAPFWPPGGRGRGVFKGDIKNYIPK